MTESPPLHPKAQRRANPFAEACRNNFPSLESAFSIPTKATNGSSSSSDDFRSVCSHGSSFLNMSIGAMAALADHMRHVSKYGIDGEKTSELTEATDNVADTSRNSLDDKWNYLLDHSTLNVDGSFAAMFENATGVDLSFAATDTSCDYFNTSKVMGLATPDRARDMQGIVSTREDDYYFDEEDEEHDADEEASHSSAFDPEQDCIVGLNKTLSFESLNNVDISRISNAGSEFMRKSHPEESLQEPEDAFNFLNIASPSSRLHDSSFTSSPKRAPLASRDTAPKLTNFSSFSNQKRSLPPRIPTSCIDKENVPVNRSFEKIMATKKLSPIKATGNLPDDLVQAIGAGDDDPSPISFVQTTPSTESEKLNSSLTGRRKYRTVVPRRVFLDSPQDFTEEQDSFCIFSQEEEEDEEEDFAGEDSEAGDGDDYDGEDEDEEEKEIIFSIRALTESFEALFSS